MPGENALKEFGGMSIFKPISLLYDVSVSSDGR
jgi:hypothetical protein